MRQAPTPQRGLAVIGWLVTIAGIILAVGVAIGLSVHFGWLRPETLFKTQDKGERVAQSSGTASPAAPANGKASASNNGVSPSKKPAPKSDQKKAPPTDQKKTSPARPPAASSVVKASAPAQTEWRFWNAAPYATSQVTACEKLPEAIEGFKGMSRAAKDHFKKVAGTTCAGAAIVHLNAGDKLEEMWSGPDRRHPLPHVMSAVLVAELPVSRSPDGRTYRPGSVDEAAKAMQWVYEADGKREELLIPFVCFNIAWRLIQPAPRPIVATPVPVPPPVAVPPVASKCVETHIFTTAADTIIRLSFNGPAKLLDDCIRVKRAGRSVAETWPTNECVEHGCDFRAASQVLGQPSFLAGSYVPAPGMHIVYLPAQVAEPGSPYALLVCLERNPPGNPPREPTRPHASMDTATYRAAYATYQAWASDYQAWRDRWIATHSDTLPVRPHHYQLSPSGVKIATVYADKVSAPPGARYVPWGEWKQTR